MKPVLALALLTLFLGCTDPITVGSDLLGTDRAGVGETTAIDFTTRVVREDRLLTYDGGNPQPPSTFSFGQISDVNFGTSTHSAYLTPRLPRNASGLTLVPQFASLDNITIDSVVVILPIDTTRKFYGSGRDYPYSVTEIVSPVGFTEDYYNDVELPTTGLNLAADGSFTASLAPRLVRDTAIAGQALERAHVRIRLTDDFARRIDDLEPVRYAADSTFREVFPGIYLRPDGPSESLLFFSPGDPSGDAAYGGFNFYYQDSTGNPALYRMPFSLALPNVNQDFSGSLVENLLDPGTDEALVAVAGQSGLMTEITLNDLTPLQERVINRAELEIPVADVEGVSYTEYPLPSRVELFFRATTDGPLLGIEDRVELIRTRASPANIRFFLGGGLEEEGSLRFYSPAFSIHLQRILEGEVPPVLYLRVSPLENFEIAAARALLNGPGAADNPALIRVTFTDLD